MTLWNLKQKQATCVRFGSLGMVGGMEQLSTQPTSRAEQNEGGRAEQPSRAALSGPALSGPAQEQSGKEQSSPEQSKGAGRAGWGRPGQASAPFVHHDLLGMCIEMLHVTLSCCTAHPRSRPALPVAKPLPGSTGQSPPARSLLCQCGLLVSHDECK